MTTKNDLVAGVADKLKVSKEVAGNVVSETMRLIGDNLARGEEVKIAGLGVFDVKPTKGRIGRNPATGATIEIAPGKKIRFRPSSDLRARI